MPPLLVKGLQAASRPATPAITFDAPSAPDDAAPAIPRDPVQALTVSLDGSKEWTHYSYRDSASDALDAYKRSLKEKKEAWEETTVRNLVGRVLPFTRNYDGRFSATSKGLKYNFSKAWTMQMGFKPSLEMRYRFK